MKWQRRKKELHLFPSNKRLNPAISTSVTLAKSNSNRTLLFSSTNIIALIERLNRASLRSLFTKWPVPLHHCRQSRRNPKRPARRKTRLTKLQRIQLPNKHAPIQRFARHRHLGPNQVPNKISTLRLLELLILFQLRKMSRNHHKLQKVSPFCHATAKMSASVIECKLFTDL